MPADVEELISSHLAGDEAATARLVRAFRSVATAQALRTCGDPDLAEDAAQEALVKALCNVDRLRHTERFPEWLGTIARNEGHRCRQRRTDLLVDAAVGEPGAELGSVLGPPGPGTEDAFWRSDTVRRVRDALDRLPARLRRALELRYFHGCSYNEIAGQLGVPVTTAKGRLQMARDLFREWYEELEGCEQCEEQLGSFLAGQLGFDAVWAIHEHLFQCRNCLGRMLALTATRAEVLAQRANHWHGAIDELRLGMTWEMPRLERRLARLVEERPHSARAWMMTYVVGGMYTHDLDCLQTAASVEPDSRAGMIARTWIAALSGDGDETARLARLLADAYEGRRDEATLLDRVDATSAAVCAGDLELAERLLAETVAHLRADAEGPGAPTTASSERRTASSETRSVRSLFDHARRLVADRCSEASYLLMLLSRRLLGPYSAETLELGRQTLAKRPFDVGLVGLVATARALEGDGQGLLQAIGHGLAQLCLEPCPSQTKWWLPSAIISLARAGHVADALRYARRYLLALEPQEREEPLRQFVVALPEARSRLSSLLGRRAGGL